MLTTKASDKEILEAARRAGYHKRYPEAVVLLSPSAIDDNRPNAAKVYFRDGAVHRFRLPEIPLGREVPQFVMPVRR